MSRLSSDPPDRAPCRSPRFDSPSIDACSPRSSIGSHSTSSASPPSLSSSRPPRPLPCRTPRSGLYGRTSSARLGAIARRWPVLCVIGAAGASKNTAMRQLAAVWAADMEAHVPVVVPMHRLVRSHCATETPFARHGRGARAGRRRLSDPGAPESAAHRERSPRARRARQSRDQQDAAVQLIRRVADQLHPSAGLVVSAREAAVAKATTTRASSYEVG